MSSPEDTRDTAEESRYIENAEQYDVETLIAEIEKERQMTDMLDQSIADLTATVLDLDDKYERMEDEGGEWKTRFETQQETNQQLQRQIYELKEKIRQSKSVNRKPNNITIGSNNLNDLTESGLKSLVRQMEKEKASLEGQLKDFDWRLDQESKAFHKASESRRKYVTELNQASMMLSSYQRMQKMEIREKKAGTSDKRRSRMNPPVRLPEIKKKGKQTVPQNRKTN